MTSDSGFPATVPALTAADFQFEDHLAERVRPLLVDRDCIYGFGHWDTAQFAAEVNAFSRVGTGYGDGDVQKGWAVVTGQEPLRLTVVDLADGDPEAFPVTVIRSQYQAEEVA